MLNICQLKFFDNVSGVYISCDKSNNDFSIKVSEFSANQLGQSLNLNDIQIEPFLKGKRISRLIQNGIFSALTPHDLCHCSHNLSIVCSDE